MSTKIYEAYRIPKNKLNDFFAIVDPQILEIVKQRLLYLTNYISRKEIQEAKEKYNITNDDLAAFGLVEKRVLEAAGRLDSNIFAIECGFNIWLDSKYAYIVPFGEYNYWHTGVEIVYPDYIEDYSYWNNTDRPEHLTARQWRTREKKWDELCLMDWDKTRLVHNIISLTHAGNMNWHVLITNTIKELAS